LKVREDVLPLQVCALNQEILKVVVEAQDITDVRVRAQVLFGAVGAVGAL
jgi:hypothetical protein